MMYIPIMKNRQQEMKITQKFNHLFSEEIIPLFEIIKDEYIVKYEMDSITGLPFSELKPGRKRATKKKLQPDENDRITLQEIHSKCNEKKAFIDIFRFAENEYEKYVFNDVELAITVSRDFNLYQHRLLEIGNYNNFIPVISIKKDLTISNYDLDTLLKKLRVKNSAIAIRITDEYLENYSDYLSKNLTSNDFVLLDIRENTVGSKFLEIDEFKELNLNAKKILLNSPRLRKYKNADYVNRTFTDNIDNGAALEYLKNEFDGFGDFGGLKDVLPTGGGSNGQGTALGLIFSKENNEFFAIVSPDSKIGVKGYKYVCENLLLYSEILDKNSDCPVFNLILEMKSNSKFGNWATWNYLTLARYIHQQATK